MDPCGSEFETMLPTYVGTYGTCLLELVPPQKDASSHLVVTLYGTVPTYHSYITSSLDVSIT